MGTKRRYCECCDVFYVDLEEHLTSHSHKSFAENPNNYKNLDKAISELSIFHLVAAMHDCSVALEKDTIAKPVQCDVDSQAIAFPSCLVNVEFGLGVMVNRDFNLSAAFKQLNSDVHLESAINSKSPISAASDKSSLLHQLTMRHV